MTTLIFLAVVLVGTLVGLLSYGFHLVSESRKEYKQTTDKEAWLDDFFGIEEGELHE